MGKKPVILPRIRGAEVKGEERKVERRGGEKKAEMCSRKMLVL